MATIEGANIVRNGLVLNLDAANPKSYPRSGTTWRDLSGQGNVATLSGTTSFNTDFGGNIIYTLGKAICDTNSSLNITSTITLELTMFPTNNTQNGAIVSKWTTGVQTNNAYVFYLGQDAGSNKYAFRILQSNDADRTLSTNTIYNANTWYHIVCTADGSTMRIYNNGIVDSMTLSYDGTIKNITKKVTIGSLREEDGLYSYSGRVGFTRIYNRALSQSEVLQNFNATKARYGL